jgi:uncharacterized protein YbjT (DUF2867 family)
MTSHRIFCTGGTGYIGRWLIPLLLQRGHQVFALVRSGSESRLLDGCTPVVGNSLDKQSFSSRVSPADTFVQLVGVAHPSPAKAMEFQQVDLVSVKASVEAAAGNGVKHFIYISVAQPSALMKEYQKVRAEGERLIRDAGLSATILRPWYVLGPGHRWPIVLTPLYWVMEQIPSKSARRLGLVTLNQMLITRVHAVENPPQGIRIVEVPEIRRRR